MAPIVAFGNPVYDQIITPDFVMTGRVLSGCSTNACIALTQLGRQSVLVGRVGPDFQAAFAADMVRLGITSAVSPSVETGGFRLVYDRYGSRTLDILGVAGAIDQIPVQITDAAAIVIGPIFQETPLSLLQAIVRQTAAPLFLDPQGLLRYTDPSGGVVHHVPPDIAEIARLCHVIKANEIEAQVLTGIDPRVDAPNATRKLKALGCKVAIVTLAEAGSWIDDGTHQLHIPAYATDVRDPTGAGDTYLAGFIHGYLTDPTQLYRAGCLGAAVASIWIEHTGPDTPLPSAEIARRQALLLHTYP